MLIKRVVLDRIAAGEIDLIFRRWRKPTVKTGGQLRTSVGMLDIVAVERVAATRIPRSDAKRAGYETKAALVRDLASRPEGDVYRIEVALGGEDPRIALRNSTELSHDDRVDLDTRLARLDTASKTGPWTRTYLELLADNPRVRAQDLADGLGLDKPTFKNNVRKLKTLGLTISHSPGYEISPRGLAYLDR
ncbi:MAG: winged helix-turn-helix domain-containing protein [Actinomycetota bacterium]